MVLTGGYGAGATVSDAAIARQYVLEKGIPAKAIFIEERSTVTRENIRYAKQILRQQQWRTALLVSDPLHMLRLKTIAQDNGIDSRSSPTRSTRYKSWWAQTRFLLRETFITADIGFYVICLYKITVLPLKQVIISVNF